MNVKMAASLGFIGGALIGFGISAFLGDGGEPAAKSGDKSSAVPKADDKVSAGDAKSAGADSAAQTGSAAAADTASGQSANDAAAATSAESKDSSTKTGNEGQSS